MCSTLIILTTTSRSASRKPRSLSLESSPLSLFTKLAEAALAEAGIQLRRARESAIDRLNRHLTKAHLAERLNAAVWARLGRFHAGWKLSLKVQNEQFELLILI